MKRLSILVSLAALALLTSAQAEINAQTPAPNVTSHVIQRLPGATVDWSELTLRVVAHAEPEDGSVSLDAARTQARRAAEDQAQAQLLRALGMLRINERETVAEALAVHPALEKALQKMLREFEVRDVVYYSHGGIDLDVEIPLAPLLPKLLGRDEPVSREAGDEAARRSGYTGVIIDMQGLVFHPVFAPNLLAEDGRSLFNVKRVAAAALAKRGAVSYYADVEAAKAAARVGKNPLVIRALRLEARDAAVIPSHAARSLEEADLGAQFLEEGRVVLVLPNYRPS